MNETRTPSGRLIEKDWRCKRSGDCCRGAVKILMKPEERAAIEQQIGPDRASQLTWSDWPVNGLIALHGGPCPLLTPDNQCSVYAVRPYVCRRWGCFRPDPSIEPLEQDSGFLQSPCTRERYQASRAVRRQLTLMQRDGQKWAKKHGWTGKET